MTKKGEYVKLKNFERKIKSPFIIYTDFEITLTPEDNEQENPNESCTNIYQKHNACSYSHKLVCAGEKFIKSFKSYFGKEAVTILLAV